MTVALLALVIGYLPPPPLTKPAAIPPYSIQMIDYQESEPLTDRNLHPAQYPAIEFQVGSGSAPAVVWTRKVTTRTVVMTFKNPTNVEHDANLTMGTGTYVTSLGTVNLGVSASDSVLHFTPMGTASVTITLTGLPGYVAKGDLTVALNLSSSVASLAGSPTYKVYQTEDHPIGIQSPVWQEVLEDVCGWSLGQAGVPDCSRYTTTGLFGSSVFQVYDPQSTYYTVDPDVERGMKYRLKKFFEDRALAFTIVYDCRDVSNYLIICFRALGFDGAPTRVSTPGANWTNDICSTGNDPTSQSNYTPYWFNFHQIALVSGLAYDATAAQWRDPSDAPFKNAPWGWTLSSYFQSERVGEPITETGFNGLARGYFNGVALASETWYPQGEWVINVIVPRSLTSLVSN